jgi:hypothetical protein
MADHHPPGYYGQYVREARKRLVVELGAKCVKCGGRRRLEFHHPHGRDWPAAKVSSKGRLQRYRREAREGKVVLRCFKCHERGRVPEGMDR